MEGAGCGEEGGESAGCGVCDGAGDGAAVTTPRRADSFGTACDRVGAAAAAALRPAGDAKPAAAPRYAKDKGRVSDAGDADGASSSPTTADLNSSTLAENDEELPFETSAF